MHMHVFCVLGNGSCPKNLLVHGVTAAVPDAAVHTHWSSAPYFTPPLHVQSPYSSAHASQGAAGSVANTHGSTVVVVVEVVVVDVVVVVVVGMVVVVVVVFVNVVTVVVVVVKVVVVVVVTVVVVVKITDSYP